MAITVGTLYVKGSPLYQMNLLAGHKGLDNLVQWVHIIEDSEVGNFLHGHELVFTAGIMNHDEYWLLNFTKSLVATGVSALVVNIGPYTKKVPENVISYCNEVGMPLFTIPWKTRMVDMTRDFCHRIIQNDNTETSIATTFKNLLFGTGDEFEALAQLERYGFAQEDKYCFVCISLDNEMDFELGMEHYNFNAVKVAKSCGGRFTSFQYKRNRIIALAGFGDEDIRNFVQGFVKASRNEKTFSAIHIGVSQNLENLTRQSDNFRHACDANGLALKRGITVLYYQDLDLYKVLFAVNDKNVLKDYYQEVLGKIEAYDADNNSDLLGFLKLYLDNNCSPQIVAEKEYIHRNTVNNQLKKIEKITGLSMSDLDTRVKCNMCFCIREIL